jgi:hypothetical protein
MSWQYRSMGYRPPEKGMGLIGVQSERPPVPAETVAMQRQASSFSPRFSDYWPDPETLSPSSGFYLGLAQRLYEQDGYIGPFAQQVLEMAGVLVVELGEPDMPYYGFVALNGAGIQPVA